MQKMKCTIHSDHGSIMIIPRENNLVRLYIQIASSTDKNWNPRQQVTTEEVQASAKKILQPFWIEWDRVEWYSVYPIGQGIAEKYTLDHRVFMGGDACHTHSVGSIVRPSVDHANFTIAQGRSGHEHCLLGCTKLGVENSSC